MLNLIFKGQKSYLVRDEDQYAEILRNNPYDNISIDLEQTAILQAHINPQRVAGQSDDTIDGFPCYRNIDGMSSLIDDFVDFASNKENLVVEKIDIGDSWEKSGNSNQGDDIFAMKVTGEGVAANCLSTEKELRPTRTVCTLARISYRWIW